LAKHGISIVRNFTQSNCGVTQLNSMVSASIHPESKRRLEVRQLRIEVVAFDEHRSQSTCQGCSVYSAPCNVDFTSALFRRTSIFQFRSFNHFMTKIGQHAAHLLSTFVCPCRYNCCAQASQNTSPSASFRSRQPVTAISSTSTMAILNVWMPRWLSRLFVSESRSG